jgi:hypothetical protein
MVHSGFFGVAHRGRAEPRGPHNGIGQQELSSLRVRQGIQSVGLPTETGHGYQTGGCRRKVLEISARHSTDDQSRVVWYNGYLSGGLEASTERPGYSQLELAKRRDAPVLARRAFAV